MALASGIAPSVWAAEGEQAIVTAIELLRAKPKHHNRTDEDDEDQPQMSG